MFTPRADAAIACLTALIIATGLSGCATAPSARPGADRSMAQPGLPISAPAGAAAEAAPPEAHDWSGRFSVLLAHTATDRQDAAAGRFLLSTQSTPEGPTLWLELASPLGQTLVSGRREANGLATLQLSDGRKLRAHGLDALIQEALGWPLPIERLPDWLNDRFEAVVARDADGGVTRATDQGWRIERDPGRWALQRAVPDGSLRIVLVLDHAP